MKIFEREDAKLLVKALTCLSESGECVNFLEDLMTEKEILDLSQRIMVAKLLSEKKIYSKIEEETGASSATISRVNKCYQYGEGGYSKVLEKLKEME